MKIRSLLPVMYVLCYCFSSYGATRENSKPHFINPIVDKSIKCKGWKGNSPHCLCERAYDGKWALAIDSSKTPGRGYYKWATYMVNIKPNTDYQISFDRMYDKLTKSSIGCHIFGREVHIQTSDQPRIWDNWSIQINSGSKSGKVEFDIFHYHYDSKTWFRNFRIKPVQVVILSPRNGEIIKQRNPILRWKRCKDASFAIQLSQDPKFPPNKTKTIGPILDKDYCQVAPPLASGKWYWRIAVASSSLINPQQAVYSKASSFAVASDATVIETVNPKTEIKPIKSPTTVRVKDGRIFINNNNNPTFLIGLYAVMENRDKRINGSYMTEKNVASCEPLFKELADAGFNTVQNYGTASGISKAKGINAYLDLADKYGLYVLMQLAGVEGMHKDIIEKQIRTFGHHRSIIAWLLVDEGDMKGWSPVKAKIMRDFIKRLDPSRLVGMVVRDCSGYVNAVDLLLPDPYTLRSTPRPQYSLYAQLLGYRNIAIKAWEPTTVVPILQAFKFEDEFDKANRNKGRVPSLDEERCISYLSIAADNQGVLFYAYHSSATYLKQYPRHWADMKKLANELRKRTPIFLAESVAPACKIKCLTKGKGIIQFARKYKNSEYLFIINPGTKAKEFVIIPNSTVKSLQLLEKNKTYIITAHKKINDIIRPFGVMSYKITY